VYFGVLFHCLAFLLFFKDYQIAKIVALITAGIYLLSESWLLYRFCTYKKLHKKNGENVVAKLNSDDFANLYERLLWNFRNNLYPIKVLIASKTYGVILGVCFLIPALFPQAIPTIYVIVSIAVLSFLKAISH
jgi:hypothetical protein